MPSEDEIIDLLRKTKANEPDKFQQYVDYYKNKYPDFYNKKIKPMLEGKPVEEPKEQPMEKKESKLANPADALAGEVKPLGSAEVGEELDKKKEDKKEPYATTPDVSKMEESKTPIKRENKTLRNVLIIFGIILVLAIIGTAIYFFLP